jgi:hypothetical protein
MGEVEGDLKGWIWMMDAPASFLSRGSVCGVKRGGAGVGYCLYTTIVMW